jgi:hypothetical protein
METPEKIIIVPYRNRDAQKKVFMSIMPEMFEGERYRILFVHQNDDRNFNRGAMKNIGFIYTKETWPNHYKDITIIFHDIDTLPYYKGQINYNTTKGVVKHLYGFKNILALGGIFAIKGEDFEKTKGFPNFWSWGWEDNVFYERMVMAKIKRDTNNIIDVNSKHLIQLDYNKKRKFNPEILKYKISFLKDNYTTITNTKYETEKIKDNIYMIHVNKFNTPYNNENVILTETTTKDIAERKHKNWRHYERKSRQYANMRKTQGLMPRMF